MSAALNGATMLATSARRRNELWSATTCGVFALVICGCGSSFTSRVEAIAAASVRKIPSRSAPSSYLMLAILQSFLRGTSTKRDILLLSKVFKGNEHLGFAFAVHSQIDIKLFDLHVLRIEERIAVNGPDLTARANCVLQNQVR